MYETPTYAEILAGANVAEARAKADRRNRLEEEGGPQPPAKWEARMDLRWMLSPTPGERPTLQQLWVCTEDLPDSVLVGSEEWRNIPFVNCNGRNVV